MKYFNLILISLSVLLLPGYAQANVGIPIIMYGEPLMILFFIPVLFIEAAIYKIKLNKTTKSSFLVSLGANTYTTILGYPISWLLLFLYQLAASSIGSGIAKIVPLPDIQLTNIFTIILFMPAWLPPFYGIPVDLTMCILIIAGLVPAYYISVNFEYSIIKKLWGASIENKETCILANRITYSIILLSVIIMFFYFYFTQY